jgi:hypothetical protein
VPHNYILHLQQKSDKDLEVLDRGKVKADAEEVKREGSHAPKVCK